MIRELLDRLFPHDTLVIDGAPYMRRWYVFGYAPTPDGPDALMVCATCRLAVVQFDGRWLHEPEDPVPPPGWGPHPPVAVSAERPGWRWQNHGLGAVRLHEVITSDDSRAFHDHPWPFLSVGLRGSYVEETPFIGPDGTVPAPGEPGNWNRTMRAPFVNRKAAGDLHVLRVPGRPVWTLFFTRPKVRSWGFAGPFGWLPWRSFDAEFPERNAWTET